MTIARGRTKGFFGGADRFWANRIPVEWQEQLKETLLNKLQLESSFGSSGIETASFRVSGDSRNQAI